MAHSTGPIPNENQVSCRTLVACLVTTLQKMNLHRHRWPRPSLGLRQTVRWPRQHWRQQQRYGQAGYEGTLAGTLELMSLMLEMMSMVREWARIKAAATRTPGCGGTTHLARRTCCEGLWGCGIVRIVGHKWHLLCTFVCTLWRLACFTT